MSPFQIVAAVHRVGGWTVLQRMHGLQMSRVRGLA